jgi:hypothetical protein
MGISAVPMVMGVGVAVFVVFIRSVHSPFQSVLFSQPMFEDVRDHVVAIGAHIFRPNLTLIEAYAVKIPHRHTGAVVGQLFRIAVSSV